MSSRGPIVNIKSNLRSGDSPRKILAPDTEDANLAEGSAGGDGQHRVGELWAAHHEIWQQRVGLVVDQRCAVDARRVQSRGTGHHYWRRGVPFVLAARMHVDVGEPLDHRRA